MNDATVFLIHPDTGEAHTIAEAATILGMTKGGIHTRLRHGDTGRKLWRPQGVKSALIENGDPPDKSQYIKCREEDRYVV